MNHFLKVARHFHNDFSLSAYKHPAQIKTLQCPLVSSIEKKKKKENPFSSSKPFFLYGFTLPTHECIAYSYGMLLLMMIILWRTFIDLFSHTWKILMSSKPKLFWSNHGTFLRCRIAFSLQQFQETSQLKNRSNSKVVAGVPV